MSGVPAIELRDLARSFNVRGERVLALRGLDLAVPQGQTVGILGSNGAGKTTLIKIIATLLLPTAGTARIHGHDVRTATRQARDRLAVVFGGERGLYNRLSVSDNLRYFALLQGVRHRDLDERCRQTLDRVNLAHASDRRVETLSRGMRQRLHLALGLVARRPLLMLDEPTIGLDPVEARRLRGLVRECSDEGTTILITSHYLHDIEELAERVILLEQGAITHDLPRAQFQQLVDDIAVIRVRGSGSLAEVRALEASAPPDLSVSALEEDPDGGDWQLRMRTRAWSSEVFAFLARLSGSLSVDDVEIEGLGLEEVFVDLHQRAEAEGRA